MHLLPYGIVTYLIMAAALVIYAIFRERKRADILVMQFSGVIVHSDAPESMYQKTMRTLDMVDKLRPKALIVQVNSPGGSAAASHEIYVRLNQLRAKGIKIVSLMGDVAASGGLYVAVASDHVIASPGTITGSIGCLIQGFEYGKLLDAVNVGVRTIRSGKFKGATSPFETLKDDARAMLQGLVDEARNDFCTAILFTRGVKGLTMAELDAFADGRVFGGRKAIEHKLVDSIGSLPIAIEIAAAIANVPPGRRTPRLLRPRMPFLVKMGPAIPGMRLENRLLAGLPDPSLMGIPLLLWKP